MGKKGEATKEKILDTARTMFWKQNYHGIKVDEIVKEAGVNKASFYHYFESKESLALEALHKNFTQTQEYVFDGAFEASDHPEKRLEEIFKRIYGSHKDVFDSEDKAPGCPFVNVGSELAYENEEIREKINEILETFYGYWTKIYIQAKEEGLTDVDIPKKQMGKRLHTILNGAMFSSRIHRRPKDVLDAIPVAKQILGLS